MTWRDRDDDTGAPDVIVLRTSRPRARKERRLGCGHVVKVGTCYTSTVLIVDGEFSVDTGECDQCWDELQAEEHELAAASLESDEEPYVDDWGGVPA